MKDFQNISYLSDWAVALLRQLISFPSISRNERATAGLLEKTLNGLNIPPKRIGNNVWAVNKNYNPSLPVLLLNSHHDTVPPNSGYTLNPYQAVEKDGKLYGLGSNDAGASLVSLLSVFLHFYESDLPFNIVFGASAEEEISGKEGIELMLPELPKIDFAIVGEPTGMDMAVAQKGLMVLDGVATGKSGHAARDEGDNALYKVVEDIQFLKDFVFEKVSDLLGPVHLTVTSVETKNKAHNVIPDECTFIVDVRVNELYTFNEILSILRPHLKSRITPRSTRLKPNFIPMNHPLVRAGLQTGLKTYGSPTLSDMALMDFPAVKVGPGQSSRSHTADEFIYIEEIEKGIEIYISLLEHLKNNLR